MRRPEFTEKEWDIIKSALGYYSLQRHDFAAYTAKVGSCNSQGNEFTRGDMESALAAAQEVDELAYRLSEV